MGGGIQPNVNTAAMIKTITVLMSIFFPTLQLVHINIFHFFRLDAQVIKCLFLR
jgi:hypothetical protein